MEDKLLDAICANLEDWPRYLILADWYEENGQQGAALACRWLGKTGHRPFNLSGSTYQWYDTERAEVNGYDPESDIPHEIYSRLSGVGYDGGRFMEYRTAKKAVEDFIISWIQAHAEAGVEAVSTGRDQENP